MADVSRVQDSYTPSRAKAHTGFARPPVQRREHALFLHQSEQWAHYLPLRAPPVFCDTLLAEQIEFTRILMICRYHLTL